MRIGFGEMWLGDCIDLMRNIPDGSVDIVITSPPYDNLRTYNDGDAWTFDVFMRVADELVRVLKQGGVIVWNVGDATVDGSETGTSFRQALHFKDVCGLRLHDTMIWQKPNFSNPSKSRYHQVFEYVFVFSKGKPATFNPLLDRPNVYAGKQGSQGRNTVTQRNGSKKERKITTNTDFGMRHNVWLMNTAGQDREAGLHPAMFPVAFAVDHVRSWSNPGDLVLDPFSGSGTTAVAAQRNARRFICIERDPAYYLASCGRIWKECQP